jgi:hypothetical protein
MSQFKVSLPVAAQTAHIFVDASNVNVLANEIPALDAIARSGFSRFATAFVVGSSEDRCLKPSTWSSLGYQVSWTERHGRPESDFRVDTTIVAAMQKDILIHTDASDRVMVLLSGDGNDNDGLPSFRDAVNLALSHGWSVKLICYKPNSIYRALESQYPGRMQIRLITSDEIAQGVREHAAAASTTQHRASREAFIGGKSRSRTPSPPELLKGHCTHFAAGYCKYGDACNFIHLAPRHPPPTETLPIHVPMPNPRYCSNQSSNFQPAMKQRDDQHFSAFDIAVMERVEQVIRGEQRAFTITTHSTIRI